MIDTFEPGTFQPEVDVLQDGTHVLITLTLTLPDGTHIEPHEPEDPFLIPTVVTVAGLDGVDVVYPQPTRKELGWNDVALEVLAGRLDFSIRGRVASETNVVTGGLTYQPCVGGACLPPRTAIWTAPIAAVSAR